MRYWLVGIGVLVTMGVAVGIFLFVQKPHEITIPGLSPVTTPFENNTNRDEASQKLNEARTALTQAKSARIPSATFQTQLDTAQRAFDERKFADAKTAAETLTATLTAELAQENKKPKIAITFDAGAGAGPAPDLVVHLRSDRVKITLFSTGKWAEQNPELLKQLLTIDNDTHNELGNHTYSHPHLVSDALTDDQIREQIAHTENIFQGAGFAAKPRFRYPYGEHNAHTDDIVTSLDYRIIGWTVDSLGWKGELTPDQIVERVVGKIKPNGIVLMHVGSPQDVAAFPLIVERLQSQYRFVFISEL